MASPFPELNSFGTLFKFAVELESSVARLAEAASSADASRSEALTACA